MYDSIKTLTIETWTQIHETGNILLLLKNGFCKRHILDAAWNKINDEYIDEFGINETYRQYLEAKRSAIYWAIENALHKNAYNKVMQQSAMQDYETFFDGQQRAKIGEIKTNLERFMGFKLDTSKISVYDFYHYQQAYLEDIKLKQKQSA